MTLIFILAFITCFFMFILPDALTAQEHEVNNRIKRSISHPEYVEIGSSKIGWTMIVLGIIGMIVVPVIWLFI